MDKYNFREVFEVEKDKEFISGKSSQATMLCVMFCISCAIVSVSFIQSRYLHPVITGVLLAAVMMIAAMTIFRWKRPDISLTIIIPVMMCILAYEFLFDRKTDTAIDIYWIYMLFIPPICYWLTGLRTGTLLSLSGFVLASVLMWTPLSSRLPDYGNYILIFYPVIYMMMIIVSVVIQYKIENYQLEIRKAQKKHEDGRKEHMKNLEGQIHIFEKCDKIIQTYINHMNDYNSALGQMLEDGQVDEALEYIQNEGEVAGRGKTVQYCANYYIDGIISIYAFKTAESKCHLYSQIDVPDQIDMSNEDLMVLLESLLENALDRQDDVPERERYIDIYMKYKEGRLKCRIENRYKQSNDILKDKSTVYMENIKNIAERYNGYALFEEKNGILASMVIIVC